MKKILWRIAMWRTQPALRISFEEWDKRRSREKKERELFLIEYFEIPELEGSMRHYESESWRIGLDIEERGDYYEDRDRLNRLLQHKGQLMSELAQPS
jgi:hypothetical protein